jgi:dipeptidyl aminopeptidase/acylaminoacyl peptidase
MGQRLRRFILLGAGVAGSLQVASAQGPYHELTPAVARILDAPTTPIVKISPDRSKLLLQEQAALPPLSDDSVAELVLAGQRIIPRTGARARSVTYSALIVQPIGAGETRRIVVPWKARIGNTLWSPDGNRVAFTLEEDTGISLWVAESWSGDLKLLLGPVLNGAFGEPCQWMPSGTALLCRRIPADRPAAPASPGEAALFDHYYTDQLTVVPLSGTEWPVGAPGVHANVETSPDGRYLIVRTIHPPYSPGLSSTRFPARTEVWDQSGKLLLLASDRGAQGEPFLDPDAVPEEPRDVGWRSDAPATLVWVQAQDGGDPAVPATVRDRLFVLDAPFSDPPNVLADLAFRSQGVIWGRGDLAVVTESWSKSRSRRSWAVNPSRPGAPPRLLLEFSTEDGNADPGKFVTRPGPGILPLLVISKDGRSAYLIGNGASSEGDRPFLDRLDLATGRILRLWRSAAPFYEEVMALMDPDAGRVITRRESATEPGNYFVRDLRQRGPARPSQLTRFSDPAVEFSRVSRQQLSYARKDGVRLSGTLYLPPGYERAQGPLPFLFWVSPREYQSAAAGSPVAGSPYRFIRPSGASHLFLLLSGYGVLDGPAMPTLDGSARAPGASEVEQLVANARAAVEKLVAMGLADPGKVAVGGHGGGAELTGTLLAGSDLFRAGIAVDGRVGPTQPPKGPLKAPLLIIRGMADDEAGAIMSPSGPMPGTTTGEGESIRVVAPPPEAWGFRAREQIGTVLFEMTSWLDRYVKGAKRVRE